MINYTITVAILSKKYKAKFKQRNIKESIQKCQPEGWHFAFYYPASLTFKLAAETTPAGVVKANNT